MAMAASEATSRPPSKASSRMPLPDQPMCARNLWPRSTLCPRRTRTCACSVPEPHTDRESGFAKASARRPAGNQIRMEGGGAPSGPRTPRRGVPPRCADAAGGGRHSPGWDGERSWRGGAWMRRSRPAPERPAPCNPCARLPGPSDRSSPDPAAIARAQARDRERLGRWSWTSSARRLRSTSCLPRSCAQDARSSSCARSRSPRRASSAALVSSGLVRRPAPPFMAVAKSPSARPSSHARRPTRGATSAAPPVFRHPATRPRAG